MPAYRRGFDLWPAATAKENPAHRNNRQNVNVNSFAGSVMTARLILRLRQHYVGHS
jgi:hypothetical protein